MNKVFLPLVLAMSIFLSFFACQKSTEIIIEDYADFPAAIQLEITLPNGVMIPASLRKPVGKLMDVVLLIPQKDNLVLDNQIEARYIESGLMVFRLNQDVFYNDETGEEATLSAIRFLKSNLGQFNIELGRLIVHGNFAGSEYAYLSAFKNEVDAVILAEPIANSDIWQFAGGEQQLTGLHAPFLLISAEEKPDRLKVNLLAMENSYHNCGECITGSQFVYHPGTAPEWNQDAIWQLIFEFLDV